MRERRRSLRARVTGIAALAVLGILAVGALLVVLGLDATLTAAARDAAEDRAGTIADRVESGARDPLAGEDGIAQVLRDGRVAFATEDARDDAEGALPRDDGAVVAVDGEAHVVAVEGVDGGAEVVVAVSLESVGEATSAAGGLLLAAVPLLAIAAAGIVWIATGRALRPVERLRTEVDAIGPDDLSRRVAPPGGAAELHDLAATMNGMLDRVDRAQAAQRRFVADASHELRSPIASLRQHAQVAAAHPDSTDLGELADLVDAESSRLAELVDAMLVLARSGELAAVSRDELDLDDLVLAEAARLRALGRREVSTGSIAPARLRGDAGLLARALRNLGDNASRHASARVELSLVAEPGLAVVRVDDDGAGIPEPERERVLERFVRLDEARSRDAGGAGLGLAIVAEAARRHGGAVRVDRSPLGGARLELRLPVS